MPETVTPTAPEGNCLLAALSGRDRRRLEPHLEPVGLSAAQVLYRPGRPIRHVYFPDAGLVSLTAGVGNGHYAETGVVGREGMAGIPVFLGLEASPFRVVVQVPGPARRLEAARFRAAVATGGALARLLTRYLGLFLTQVGQVAACNSRHSVERRCCRWLALVRVHLGRDEFPLTQKFLATMLGVRRTGVSVVAGNLRRAGLIRYTRGVVTIRDAAGLEAACCDCFHIIRSAYDDHAAGL